jgi:UDP-N-acetylglucosamine 2-epimerase (non-hydrolysing)
MRELSGNQGSVVTAPLSIDLIAAARPNFMKIAPLYHALAKQPWCEPRIVHTGQHTTPTCPDAFSSIGVAEAARASRRRQRRTRGADRRVMIEYEKRCLASRPT